MKRLLALAVSGFAVSANAAPYVVTDPLMSHTTHCGVFVDTQPKVTIQVTVEGSEKICKYDIAGLSGGNHTVRMTAIVNDPVFGVLESQQSLPLTFAVPVVPATPLNLRIIP